MRTMRAVDANRQFFYVLKQVSMGEEFLIISRRKPVATISPVRKAGSSHLAARSRLFDRLRSQEVTGVRAWTRDELYVSTQ